MQPLAAPPLADPARNNTEPRMAELTRPFCCFDVHQTCALWNLRLATRKPYWACGFYFYAEASIAKVKIKRGSPLY
jgi:hypothetical protein